MASATQSNRDRLLAAGLAAIHARGFAATGVQEITAAAGVPKGSFYNHFESKAAFGLAAIEAYWAAAAPVVDLLRDTGQPVPERILRHLRAVLAATTANGRWQGCLLGNFAVEAPTAGPDIRDRVAAIHEEWTAALAQTLAIGVAAGEVRADIPPDLLARLLLAAWNGTVLRAKVEPDDAGFDALLVAIERLLRPS